MILKIRDKSGKLHKASDYLADSSRFQCGFCEQHKLWRPSNEDRSDLINKKSKSKAKAL